MKLRNKSTVTSIFDSKSLFVKTYSSIHDQSKDVPKYRLNFVNYELFIKVY